MAGLDAGDIVRTTDPALPQIYAYTTPGIAYHEGWTKIGYTERDVETRIWEQTHTAGIKWDLEWNGDATWADGSGTFRDGDFHAYLQKKDVKREPKTEWFEITGDESHMEFHQFRGDHGVLDVPAASPYTLRDEQEDFVCDTLSYARAHEGGEFLWNAKPRFGKTLTAYELVKRMGAQKVLIVTNRPAIANSWYDDYVKFMGDESGLMFVSSTDSLAGRPHVLSYGEYSSWRASLIYQDRRDELKGLIEFVSLQDLKGGIEFGGAYEKLEEVEQLDWDLLIIDEAHEGVDTFKTDVAFDHVTRKFTLHLSGTPFKAIANEKFPPEAIKNWTYADEQAAKRDWPEDAELPNPYEDLPKMSMLTYQMSEVVEDEARSGTQIGDEDTEYAFDLNEFFATDGRGRFLHDADVDKFLDALVTQRRFPFSTPELRDELRHTFWMLARVDSARALAKKLQRHPVFGSYEVVLAAGDGRIDDGDANERSLDKVREAIAGHDRTITLSVGQLTTGVTVPEWTAVLMLCNMRSPALYMQAAFRCQNPCLFDLGKKGYARKTNAYVFDFDPARTLLVFEEFANDLSTSTAGGGGTTEQRKKNIRQLLNFFPVYSEDDDGEMVELDAEKVLSVPRKIRSREVVRRGFMSNFLFANISNVFHAPAKAIEILQKFRPCEQGKLKDERDIPVDGSTADDLSLNEDGEVEVPYAEVIGTATDVFGGKVYGDIEADVYDDIEAVAESGGGDVREEDKALEEFKEAFSEKIAIPLVAAASEAYAGELGNRQKKQLVRRVRADAEIELNRQVANYKIERNKIEASRKSALAEAGTDEEREKVDREHDQKRKEAIGKLAEGLDASRGKLVHAAGETVVREVETSRREAEKRGLEDDIRDHLRGFSRTIPSFLMAYGDEGTTLANFDEIVPPDVFWEVTYDTQAKTGVSIDEFRFLRDGGDYEDPETGETMHFEGHLFDEVVFDDAVAEFVRLRGELANWFDEGQAEDIFDYVPPQRTNQIFTPKRVVRDMVDMFEAENPGCFDDPDNTFADLYMKSGLFIAEIVKRLYSSEGVREAIPDDRERLRHILERQVFGVAPSEIIYQIATHFILGYNDEVGRGCDHNFRCADTAQLAKEGKLAEWVEREFGGKM